MTPKGQAKPYEIGGKLKRHWDATREVMHRQTIFREFSGGSVGPGICAYGESMMQEARSAATGRKKTPPVAAKSSSQSSAINAAVFQQYQAAVQLVQQGKFDKALVAFEKLIPTAPFEIVERCRMYLHTCQRQIDKHGLAFVTPEERYDYAVSQFNSGFFEEAADQLRGIIADYPTADYAFYGLALIDSITGRVEGCLENLSKAIELNPKNRLQARSDNDFQNMVDDPRFTELLYPEIP
jgi:tetratricopeptide (TPR) repeat protein